jgi:hypothetical protein
MPGRLVEVERVAVLGRASDPRSRGNGNPMIARRNRSTSTTPLLIASYNAP